MPQPPQTFTPSPKRLVAPVGMVLLFVLWAGAAAFAMVGELLRPGAWPGYAIAVGVPVGMALLSVFYALSLLARTTIDAEELRIEGPLMRLTVRWADVVGYNIDRNASQGVILDLRDGRKVNVPYGAYEGDGLRRRIDAALAHLDRANLEGREFGISGRGFVALGMLGMPLLLGVVSFAMPAPERTPILLALLLLLALSVPLVAFFLTDRVALREGVLVKSSLFGTRRLPLAEVRRAEVKIVRTKNGSSEHLILTGPRTVRLSAGREGYAILRDAILAELPAGVRPVLPP